MLYLVEANVKGSNYIEGNKCYLDDLRDFMMLEFYDSETEDAIRVYDSTVEDYLHKNYGLLSGVIEFSDTHAVLTIYDIDDIV